MNSFIKTAATFAPMIAAGLGSPIAPLAVNWIFKTLGKKAPAKPEDALNAAQKIIETITPEDQAKLRASDGGFKKMADEDTEVDLMNYKVRLEEIREAGVANARNLAIKAGAWPQIILSFAVFLLFSAVIYLVFTTPLDQSNQILLIMVGGIITAFTQVLNYWFGSTKSSGDKTALLQQKK